MTQKKKRQFGPWSWTEQEIELLKKIYPHGNTQKVAKKLKRPLTAVRQKAYDLGIKTNTYNYWTNEQIQLLIKLYPTTSAQALCKKLEHSPGSIRIKASQLNLKKRK